MAYEFCVMHSNFPQEPHRGPMPENGAWEWVHEFIRDGGKEGAFYVAQRFVTPWVESHNRDIIPPLPDHVHPMQGQMF